jgi:hypothetical protein
MEEMRNAYKSLIGKPEGKTILKWILSEYSRKAWTGLIWLRI